MISFNLTKHTMLSGMAWLFFVFANTANAQCPTASITLTTQAEVNAFAATYPNCTQLLDHLYIGNNSGTSDITDLSPLGNITTTLGGVDIAGNPNLTTLNGLNFTSVSSFFEVQYNPLLTNLDGLSSLTSVGGGVDIAHNAVLSNVNGLANLTSIGGALILYDNDAITNLDGLSNLVSTSEYIALWDNAMLNNVWGLRNLTIPPGTNGGLYIEDNPLLEVCNWPNFCTYLANPASTHPRGISGNATTCATEQAVITACQTAATTCPAGNVFLTTQAEVNAFGTLYPNCATMNGSLFIGVTTGSSNITDISALSGLTTVPGYISIDNNGQLQNLNGLQDLVSVGFHLQVYNNDQLTDVSALDDLKTVGSYFKIEDNGVLANVNGFSALEVVGADFTIKNNALLQTIDGFASLDSIKGIVTIRENSVMQTINGFASVVYAGNSFFLQNNNTLQSIGGFGQLRHVAQNFFMGYHPQLQTITGFTNLNTIGGYLSIGANTALQNLNSFSNLITVGRNLSVTDNTILNDISGLQNTTFQPFNGNGLGIVNNPQLSLCNLPNFCAYLANPAGTHPRNISGNATTCATEQDVITACQTPTPCPTGDVTLATQAEVNAFGTNHSTCTAINGSLFIGVNAGTSDITDLSPLAGIQTVSGYVWVANNSGLQNLNGLHNISNVGGALNITGNATLQNLNGLSSLATVGQDIYLVENSTLTNISALQNTTFTPASGFGLTLRDNTLLEVCNYPNFCAYIANDATTHPRVISGNATTCATEQALQAACLSIGINDMGQTVINAYPNPVKDVLNISTDLSITEVAVMNMLGQTLVAKQANTTIVQVDMSMLPAGNYIVKVTTANGAQVGKVTKQ